MRSFVRSPLPPGPRTVPGLGVSFAYARDPFRMLERLTSRWGPISFTWLLGMPMFTLGEPEDIEHVLVRNASNYKKDWFLQLSKRILGEGLLTSEGDFWLRQRRLAQPAFHPRRVDAYAPAMAEASQRAMAEWRAGEVRAVDEDMRRLTLDIAVRTLFGGDLAEADRVATGRAVADLSAFTEAGASTFGGMLSVAVPALPTEGNRRVRRALADLDRIVYGLIESRRRRAGEGEDLLSRLLAAQEDGVGMTDAQLRDEVLTIFLAGHETTALALTYTLRLLAEHPDVQKRLADEALGVLGGRAPEAADLARLPYVEDVVKESMRLHPPAYVIGREAIGEDEIRGWRVRPKDNVIMSAWAMQRSPRFYEAPLEFRPERWTPEFERALPRFAYFPFGGGPRVCIGAGFAMLEARVALATILQRFGFERADAAPLRLQAAITARPRDPVRLRLLKR